jgi:hypothetical protein
VCGRRVRLLVVCAELALTLAHEVWQVDLLAVRPRITCSIGKDRSSRALAVAEPPLSEATSLIGAWPKAGRNRQARVTILRVHCSGLNVFRLQVYQTMAGQ